MFKIGDRVVILDKAPRVFPEFVGKRGTVQHLSTTNSSYVGVLLDDHVTPKPWESPLNFFLASHLAPLDIVTKLGEIEVPRAGS